MRPIVRDEFELERNPVVQGHRRVARPAALTIVLAVELLLGARAEGRPAASARTYAAARTAWQRCFPAGSQVPEFPDEPSEPMPGWSLDVSRTAGGYRVKERTSGSGTRASSGSLELRFQPRGCRAVWMRTASADGDLATRTRIGWANRAAPDERELRSLAAAPARADDRAHALPRAWLVHRCDGGADSGLLWSAPIEGPIAPAQPWHPGAPPRPPWTFWPAATLAAIGARTSLLPATDAEQLPAAGANELTGIIVPGFGRPVRTFTAAGVELFEAAINDRNGARAIAIHDPIGHRHRWVVVTRGCVQGTTVSWIGAVGAVIVGVTHSQIYDDGDAILVVDVPTGTAWAIRLPAAIREAAIDAPITASLGGSTLALRTDATTATVELAPLLARIPPR